MHSRCIIVDQDSTFMSSLVNYLFIKLDIKMKTVTPHNHQSLQAEHGIESLSTILMKHLTNLVQMWPKYLLLATFAYNTFNTPNLANVSPYELVFRRKPKILHNLDNYTKHWGVRHIEGLPQITKWKLKYLHKLLQNFKSRRI